MPHNVMNQSRSEHFKGPLVGIKLGATAPMRTLCLEQPEFRNTQELAVEHQKFKIRLANSEGRRQSALLIKKMYSWRGYVTDPNFGEAPNRITLVASSKEKTIGTVTMSLDSPIGLLADGLYRDEIQQLRNEGRKLYELTKFAVDNQSMLSKQVVASFFHISYIYGRDIHGCTDALIEVNPRHASFYEKMLGFERCGDERMCARVNAPAVLMRLELAYAESQIKKYGGSMGQAKDVRSLYPYFFTKSDELGIASRLTR